jgi:hypothetical protein
MKTTSPTFLVKRRVPFNRRYLKTPPIPVAVNSFKNLLWAMSFLIIALLCEVLWKGTFGFSVPRASYYILPAAFLIFVYCSVKYILIRRLPLLCTKGHWLRIRLYFIFLTGLFLYGLLRENVTNYIFIETILFFSLGIFLVLGVDDRVCRRFFKVLTVAFWLAFVLSLFTINVIANSVDLGHYANVEGTDSRYISSAAYTYFRPFLDLGLPLFIFGCASKLNSRWKLLQLLSLIGYLVFNVMVYKFRGAFSLALLATFAAFFIPGAVAKKIKLAGSVLLCGILIWSWLQTESGIVFHDRMYQFGRTGVIDYRLPETKRYFEEMGNEWLWGRGLGGTFDLGGMFGRGIVERTWPTVHIGWLVFTLKGGAFFLYIIISFFLAGFHRRNYQQKYDPYILTARLWLPIFFANWFVNPVDMSVAYVPVYGLSFILLARFGRKHQ